MKTCTKCQIEKPLSSFHKDVKGILGVRSHCKECVKEYNRRYTQMYPERRAAQNKKFRAANPTYEQDRKRKHKYGVTPTDFQMMLDSQSGGCAICKKPVDRSGHLDHCHRTGKVRGILCSNCNRGIGHMQECPTILMSAIEYIKEHSL